MPARVARQFGRIQRIPPDPIMTDLARLCRGAKSYAKEYGSMDDSFREFREQYRGPAAIGETATIPGEAVEGYMDWYRRVTRLRIENPRHTPAVAVPALETSYTRVIRVRQITTAPSVFISYEFKLTIVAFEQALQAMRELEPSLIAIRDHPDLPDDLREAQARVIDLIRTPR